MPLRDAIEYQFATPTRRVLVREAHAPPAGVVLLEAGRRYAEHLETFLDATDLTVAPEVTTAGGADAVTVTATVPRADAAGSPAASVVRTALLRFGTGSVVELTVYADTADAGAEAEFRRLLDSARPAATADPIAGVAGAIATGPPGRPDYPAGAVRLALTPDYHGPTVFTLVSAHDAVRYRLEAAAPAQAAHRLAAVCTILGAGVGVAATEDGRPVRYEAGPRPRLSQGRRPAAPEASVVGPRVPRSTEHTRGRGGGRRRGRLRHPGPGPRLRPRGHCPARGPRRADAPLAERVTLTLPTPEGGEFSVQ